MANIPPQVKTNPNLEYLKGLGYKMSHQGKVRDTFDLGREFLVSASDRVSIFDVVLPFEIPRKGEVLTALTHFWLTHVLSDFPHHLLKSAKHQTANAAIDLHLPNLDVRRCLVVNKFELQPFELIFRHHLGGSVRKQYEKTGIVAGQELPPGIPQWGFLDVPLFTPSTKEENGHDINITIRQ